ncbi:MAG: DUF1127 domain-containing protein [Pseudomonadota bacterium]
MPDTFFSSSESRLALPQHHGHDTRSFLRMIGHWMARARSRRRLAALDDARLADIGYSREAAAEEAAKPFWR